MSTPTIRPAVDSDLDQMGRLTVRAYVDGGHLSAENDYLRELADPAGRRDGCDLLVAVDPAGQLLGSVSLVHPHSPQREVAASDEAEIRVLAVDPDAQGRGIGSALVTECLDRARAAGYPAAALCVIEGNEGAARLYTRFGFTRVPDRDWEPAPGVRLRAYRLPLI